MVPAVAAAVLVLYLPGAALLRVLGRRGLELAALAVPASLGVIAVSAVLADAAGLRWTSLAPAVLSVVLCLAALLLLRTLPPAGRGPRGPDAVHVLASLALAMVLLVPRLVWIIGRPDNIAQSHDNMFHLNAVHDVLASGDGSSLHLTEMNGTDASGIYPAAWHDVVALVCQIAQVPLPGGINAVSLVLAGLVWPVGLLYLAWVVRPTRAALLVAALLASAFATFPYLLLEFGVVYPFFTALAVLPAVLAGAVTASSPERADRRFFLVALAACVPGLLLAHPSVAVLATGLVLPLLWRPVAASRQARVSVRIGGLAVCLVAWVLVRPPRATNWDGFGDWRTALRDALRLAPFGRPVPWVLVALVVLGVVLVIARRVPAWTLALFLLGVALYSLTQLQSAPEVRWWVSGVWYGDPFRPAALLPLTAAPLIVGAGDALAGAVSRRARSVGWPVALRVALLGAIWLAGVALLQGPAVTYAADEAHAKYRFTDRSYLLSVDERTLLGRLPATVPKSSTVIGDPFTGAALAYAYADRRTVEPYPGAVVGGADGRLVLARLDEMRRNTQVCGAVRRLRLGFVVDFGHDSVDPGRTTRVPGLLDLTPSAGFEVVDRVGDARLLRIIGCD